MSIVRSLLIQIGFKTDKKSEKSLDKTNEKIQDGVKSTTKEVEKLDQATNKTSKSWYKRNRKSISLWTLALYTAKRFAVALTNISNGIVDQDFLARSIGITRNELKALNQVAGDFGFKNNDFIDIVGKFNKRLEDTRNGFDNLQDINRLLGINLNPNETAIQNIFKILRSISDITDEITRKQLAERIFGGFGIEFSDLSQDLPNFEKNFNAIVNVRSQDKDNIEQLKQYNKEVRQLSIAWTDFLEKIAINLIPIILDLKGFIDFLSKGNFLNIAKPTGSFAPLPMLGRVGGNSVSPNITINNDILVPSGTNVEQADYITSQIEKTSRSSFLEMFSILQSDYPRLE